MHQEAGKWVTLPHPVSIQICSSYRYLTFNFWPQMQLFREGRSDRDHTCIHHLILSFLSSQSKGQVSLWSSASTKKRISFSPCLPFSTLPCVFFHWQSSLLRKRLYPLSIWKHMCMCVFSHNSSLWANGCSGCLSDVTLRLSLSIQSQAGLGRIQGCSCSGWKCWYTSLAPLPSLSPLLTHCLADLKISLQICLAGCKVLAQFLRTGNKLQVYQGPQSMADEPMLLFCFPFTSSQVLWNWQLSHLSDTLQGLGWRPD